MSQWLPIPPCRVRHEPLSSLVKRVRSDDFPELDWSAAMDGDGESYVELPGATRGGGSRSVVFEFAEPQTVRSLDVEMHENSEKSHL